MKKNGTAMAAVCAVILFSFSGFVSGSKIASADSTNGSIEWKTVVSIEDEAVPLYSKPSGSKVRTPQATGAVTFGNDTALIDASNTGHGYVMVQYSGKASRIKVQVIKSGGETYSYDLNARSAYEVFPLTEGNGKYTVRVLNRYRGPSMP